MVIFPRAKINIGLRIIGKRSDGFHNIQTVFYPVRLADALEYVVGENKYESDLITETGINSGCSPEKNIVILAVRKIREIHPIPYLKLHLHKTIPTGAGLGGGSADAAYLIKSLNKYFNLGFTQTEMKTISASLGSDCPFFIDNTPSYGEGRGEILTPVDPLPDHYYLIILKPDVEVSTAEAYKGCTPMYDGNDLIDVYNNSISLWKKSLSNDFEKTVFGRYTEIGNLKDHLYSLGAVYSSMSGSGSSVYGLFEKIPEIPASLAQKVVYCGKL